MSARRTRSDLQDILRRQGEMTDVLAALARRQSEIEREILRAFADLSAEIAANGATRWPENMTISEAGEYLGGISETTVRELAERGDIDRFYIGRNPRFRRESLDAYAERQEQEELRKRTARDERMDEMVSRLAGR